jgi:hypothetical protein
MSAAANNIPAIGTAALALNVLLLLLVLSDPLFEIISGYERENES